MKRNSVKAAVLLVCMCVLAGLWQLTDSGDKIFPSKVSKINAEARPMEVNQAGPEKLIGRWLRSDGRYLIDIQKINGDGTLNAAYFNPDPVNIAQAKFYLEKSAVKVFIELKDKGYPGSTYTLVYISKRDMLGGIYFHAGIKKNFQVTFIRKNR